MMELSPTTSCNPEHWRIRSSSIGILCRCGWSLLITPSAKLEGRRFDSRGELKSFQSIWVPLVKFLFPLCHTRYDFGTAFYFLLFWFESLKMSWIVKGRVIHVYFIQCKKVAWKTNLQFVLSNLTYFREKKSAFLNEIPLPVKTVARSGDVNKRWH